MRKILLLFLILLSFVNAIEIDEYKTDVYFANGILTEPEDATDNALLLEKSIRIKRYNGNEEEMYQYIGKVTEAYNETHFSGLGDLAESLAQKLGVQGFIDDLASFFAPFSLLINETSHDRNLETQINAYKASIQSGHKVLVVAHSQGNLFTYEAREKLLFDTHQGWMDKYFKVVSIASPAMFSISNDTPLISWDNDLVAWLGIYNSSMVPNDIIKVGWKRVNGEVGSSQKPDTSYIKQEQLGDILENDWQASEDYIDYNPIGSGAIGFVDDKVHAFTFYMGEDLAEGKILNPFDGSKLNTDKAKNLIMNAVNMQIDKLEMLTSQWKSKTLGCSCKTKYAKMTHIYDPENMNQYMLNEKVKDFQEDEKGKIYRADAGDHSEYVRALDGDRSGDGVFTIEEAEQDETCYVLKDDVSAQIGEIKGISEMPDVEFGAITVALDWKSTDANLDLDVRWEEGEYDIKDTECPKEHWHIKNRSSVTEGKREIWVNLKELPQADSNVTDTVTIDIKALGKNMPFVAEINDVSDYDIGHIADIVIKYVDNKAVVRFEFTPKKNVHTGRVEDIYVATRQKPTCEEQHGEFNCVCMPCEAKIIPYLEQALAGPLSGADFKIYEASNYEVGIALYAGITSIGSDILTAGIIDVDNSITNVLKDDKLYLIEARGGVDIDSNDDYIIEGIDVINSGSIRALVLGKDLKTHGYKINILTEISYQVVKNKIGKVDDLEIREELDDIAEYLLREPVYAGVLSYRDVLSWLPTLDKKILFYDYDERFEPVVQKIYRDQDIYEDALALVYGPMERPRLKSLHLTVPEDVVNNVQIGSIEVINEGNSSIYSFILNGEGSENFIVNLDGGIYVSDVASIDFETRQKYKLKATATNLDGNTTVGVTIDISDVYDAPEVKGYEGGVLFGTALSGSWVAKVVFAQGKSMIENVELTGEGSRYFDINTSGDIVVSELGLPLIKKDIKFHFDVIASNAYGSSLPAGITIHVNAVKDIPTFHGFTAYVNEHAKSNTLIHTVSFADGAAPIDAFVLSGAGSENFGINSQGQLRVSANASIDYEKKSSFIFSLGARNIHGESENVNVYVFVKDLIDVPVLKKDMQFSVDENETSAFLIGNIVKETGLSDISSMQLTNILFRVDLDGNIYLAEGQNLDYETTKAHIVTVTATNSYGDSLAVDFTVNVNDVVDVATLEPFSAAIVENETISDPIGQINYSNGTSEVELFHLVGSGNEKFEIDKNGVVKVRSNMVFDYEELSIYKLKMRALNASGYSVYADFTIHINNILDAPELQAMSWIIDENSKNITLNGNIILNEGLSPVGSIVVRDSRGAISRDIEVNIDGKVHVLPDADLDYEKGSVREYDVIAYNDQGFSSSVVLRLNLRNVLDAPELEAFFGSIDENVAIGTVVGDISFNPGLSEVLEMSLEILKGADYINPFIIDKSGMISVKNELDYETKSSYKLMAFARNDQGVSSPSFVSIKVYDNEDGPVLNPFFGSIKEDADFGDVVGNITYKEGLDTIVSMALSGEGSENFMIDKSGNITLSDGAKLDFELKKEYNIWAQAFSLGDDSGIVDVTITIGDVNENARAGIGLWANAVVNIYRLEDDGNQTLLFTELTSDSDEYNQTGLFDSHRLELEDNKFYIYEAKNGIERDADQNGILDKNITSHTSSLYAILKGEWIRHMQKPLSINLMTDTFYQWLKDDVMAANYTMIEEKLEEPYNPIIRWDIDGTLHNTFNWNYGDGRDALVYDPIDDVDIWRYLFGNSTRLFMKGLVLSSQEESYRFFVQNTLFGNSEKIKRNDESILDSSNYLRYDLRYLSFGEGGEYYVDIVDISDSNNTVVLSEMWLDYRVGSGSKILSNDKNKYLSVISDIVYSYDVSDPLNPIGDKIQILWEGEINRVIFSSDDTLLYIANGSAGVWLVNTLNFNPKSYKVFLGNCTDVQEINATTIATLVSNDMNSAVEILDISDRTKIVHTVSFDINSSDATTFVFNNNNTILYVGGKKGNEPYLDIYRVNDNSATQGSFSDLTFLSSPIMGYYGRVIEVELVNDENEIIITTEYYKLRYDVSDNTRLILLEEVQLQELPG